MIDLDVETVGLQWYAGELFLAQFLDDDGRLEVLSHPADRGRIQWWLDRDDEFRAWNSAFDLHFLAAAGYLLPDERRWHDGMVLAHVIDERSTMALKGRAERMFGADTRDPERELKQWLKDEAKRRKAVSKETGAEFVPPNYADVPAEIMEPYAAQDVILTRRVWDSLEPKLGDDLRSVYELERGVLAAKYAAECRGLPMDRDAAERLQFRLAENLDEIERQARALAGGKSNFNAASSAQVAEALRRRGADLSFVTKTKTGAYSMDAENLAAVDDELARTVERFRAEAQLLGTYVGPMLNRSWDSRIQAWKAPFIHTDGRLHTIYRQVGARHGRMSSSDPNVQNLPRDDLRVRYLVRAGEGKRLVTADLSNIEMVLFAAYAGEGRILETIRAGGDLHALTAKMVGLHGAQRVNGFETARQQGKRFNYSIIYGAGLRSIRKAYRVPQSEARAMRDRYMAAYPEVARLQRRIEWKLAEQGYVRTLYGRRQRLERNVRDEAYKFTNYLISGTAADMLKQAAVKLHRQGVPVIGYVHDEILAEVDERDAPEVAHLLEQALTDFPELSEIVPIKAEADIVERWSDAKQPGYVPEHEKEQVGA